MPHSALCVIGSIGMRRRNFSFRPVGVVLHATPSTSVLEIRRIPFAARLELERRDLLRVGGILVLSIAVRISRSDAPQLGLALPLAVTFASGIDRRREDHARAS